MSCAHQPNRADRWMASALLASVLALAPLSARAGDVVELRADPVSRGASVTLADLFEAATGPARRVVVARAPLQGAQAVLEASRVQSMARAAGLNWTNASGLHRIIVTGRAEAAEPTAPLRPVAAVQGSRTPSSRSHPKVQVLVYTRNLMVGELISASDLQWSDEAVAGSDAVDDPDLAIGKAARRPLRVGGGVAAHDLLSPKVVHHDEIVTVAFESDGVTLTLEAKALTDAGVGDAVQVINLQSKKVIQAIASGPGTAVVGPGADMIRAAALDPTLATSRFAR